MPKFSKKKIAAVVAGVGIVAAGSGLAYAYWTSTGTGTGTATTGVGANTLLITQTSSVTGLAPGTAAQPINGSVKNNGQGSAYVTSVSVTVASVTKASGAPAGTCGPGDYTIANSPMTVNTNVAAGGTVTFSGATIAFNDTTANQDGCKGATVNLAFASN